MCLKTRLFVGLGYIAIRNPVRCWVKKDLTSFPGGIKAAFPLPEPEGRSVGPRQGVGFCSC